MQDEQDQQDVASTTARWSRRLLAAGVVAATLLAVVGGLAVTGALPDVPDGPVPGRPPAPDAPADPVTDHTDPEALRVRVVAEPPRAVAGEVDPLGGATALWDPASRTVWAVSAYQWSGTCPPVATAGRSRGVVEVRFRRVPPPGPCTADARRATAAVHGLTARPDRILLRSGGGRTTVLAVRTLGAPDRLPTCRAADLALEVIPVADGAAGRVVRVLRLRSTGTTTCSLRGHPDRVVLSGPGPGVTARRGGVLPPIPAPGPLARGGTADLVLQLDTGCRAPRGSLRRVTVTLPTGPVTTTADPPFPRPCAARVGRFGTWR